MPRKPLIRTDQFPYHITSRANNKEWFYISSRDVWLYMIKYLQKGKIKFDVKIHAFVLMNNHYHILLTTPNSNIDEFMQFFNKNLGRSIARQSGRINRIFGAPYKWCLITKDIYYINVYRYIYQNPIRKKITDSIEQYPYSSLYRGELHKLINKEEIYFENFINLVWLNNTNKNKVNDSIRKGLKKYTFSLSKDRSSRNLEQLL